MTADLADLEEVFDVELMDRVEGHPRGSWSAGVKPAFDAHLEHAESLQATLKYAGPFDLSHGPIQKYDSIGRGATRTEEVRLLYGTGFKLFGRDGFADAEAAERFITVPRPNETDIDLTAGLWLGTRTMVMAQSFNVISGGGAQAPYTYFREHKIELSVVRCISARWSVQLGAFTAPMGQNTVVEQGFMLSLWNHRL